MDAWYFLHARQEWPSAMYATIVLTSITTGMKDSDV